jgi:6-phosphofructokinase
VVLSGGQAAGGHNVIAGLFDYVATGHPHSKLYGFIGEQSLHIRRSARSSC